MGFPDNFKLLLAVAVSGLWLAHPAGAALYGLDGNGDSTKETTVNGRSVITSGVLQHQQAADNCAGDVGDPSANGAVTLEYLLPAGRAGSGSSLTCGWVAVYADAAHEDLTELVHFDGSTQAHGKNFDQIFFYSDGSAGGLADRFPISSAVGDVLACSTTVSLAENANGLAAYTPECATAPGYNNGGPAISYDFLSPVPEPGTYGAFAGALLLLALGAGKLRNLGRRK